jgi:CheY-like chemotaxis protein
VVVTVRDYGCGIPQSAITRIFDPFFTTKAGGHGLGLSICYSVVKRHGGTLEVEQLDNGSAFTFYLPAVAGVIMDSSTAAATEHKGQGLFLLMDDEEVVLESVGSMLRYFGYEVVEKNEGSAAVDFVMNTMRENVQLAGMMFDLTISGGMGGKEAIHAIRAFCPDIPAIVMSGYSENGEIVRPEEFGFNASISKPFNMKQLSETLNRVYCK